MAQLPSISTVEVLILDLIEAREYYGLELIALSGGRLKRGSVYVTLGRMEHKGFLTSRHEDCPPDAVGPARRVYRATPYGLKVRDAYLLLREALDLKPAEAQ